MGYNNNYICAAIAQLVCGVAYFCSLATHAMC